MYNCNYGFILYRKGTIGHQNNSEINLTVNSYDYLPNQNELIVDYDLIMIDHDIL